MEGHSSTGQSPQWAVVPMEEEQQEEEVSLLTLHSNHLRPKEHHSCPLNMWLFGP